MELKLYNAGVNPLYVEQNGIKKLLQPNEMQILKYENGECLFKLMHVKKDKFNSIWYLLNDMFTLEQMRTVLVVDGEYCVKSLEEDICMKIKDYEYVFDKNMSYETFVFNLPKEQVCRKYLEVKNANNIAKKAKFLYLFGGDKTLLPLVGIGLLFFLIELLFSSAPSSSTLLMTAILFVCFAFLLNKYISSLHLLRKAMREENILTYMSSTRKQYRRFSDEVIQKNLDVNAGEELYW